MLKNVTTEIKGSILTMKVDLSKSFGPSASGKTTIIATTSGAEKITDGDGNEVSLNLNIYKK